MRYVSVALTASLLAVLLLGCGGQQPAAQPAATAPKSAPAASPAAPSSPAAPKAPATPAQKVSVKWGNLQVANTMPVDYAVKKGYFDAQGISVDHKFASLQELAAMLPAGQVDIAMLSVFAAIQAKSRGFDFSMLYPADFPAAKAPDQFALIVRNDSPVQKPEDIKLLAGKKVGVASIGTLSYFGLVANLEKYGVAKDKVQWQEIGFPLMNDALLSGQVDAIGQLEPFHSIVKATGKVRVVDYPYLHLVPGMPLSAYFAKTEWLNKNKETAKKLATGLARAHKELSSDPKLAREWVQTFAGLKPEVAQNVILADWSQNVKVDVVEKLVDVALKHGAIEKKIDAKSLLWETTAIPAK